MLKRRRIGAAYERAPAERLGDWARRNLLTLIAGTAAMLGAWLLVNGLVLLLNWLSGESGDMGAKFDDSSLAWVIVKLVAGSIAFLLVVLSQSK